MVDDGGARMLLKANVKTLSELKYYFVLLKDCTLLMLTWAMSFCSGCCCVGGPVYEWFHITKLSIIKIDLKSFIVSCYRKSSSLIWIIALISVGYISGDLFDMLLPMLSIYQEYVRNHHYSLQVLTECKSNTNFSTVLKRLEGKFSMFFPRFKIVLR